MKLEHFKTNVPIRNNFSGSVEWESPSNIALVKYWGKKAEQLPANPSLSFSLNKAKTLTRVEYQYDDKQGFEFFFDSIAKPDFHPKLIQFFERIESFLPFLKKSKLRIDSSNTFPHSTGIASSASAMSALALCLIDIEQQILEESYEYDYFLQKASFIARLGSGSAARSVFGGFSSWGEVRNIRHSSDWFATPLTEVHENFSNICDTIIILNKQEKKVSSTAGHALMHRHPFAKARFEQAFENHFLLQSSLKKGNWNEFIPLVETEALSLHAMMMTGTPAYFLMEANSLIVLEKIRNFRETKNVSCCFTLDAGPNIHLLYPETERELILEFIDKELNPSLEKVEFIHDSIGGGPVKLN